MIKQVIIMGFSKKELATLLLLSKGMSAKEIGVKLSVSTRGIEGRIRTMKKELQLKNVGQLLYEAHDEIKAYEKTLISATRAD